MANNCISEIEDYGICGREKDHIVHAMLGVSYREHMFKPKPSENQVTMTVTKENVSEVAKLSGNKVEDLERMLEFREQAGKELVVTFAPNEEHSETP